MSDSIATAEARQNRPNMGMPPAPPAITERPGSASEADPGKPGDAAPADPLRALIDKMERAQALVSRVDPALAAVVRNVAEKVDLPGRLDEPTYRTRVAYLLQDMEKLVGPVAGVQPGLREEMTKLAATAPGLQNERMQALVAMTASLDGKALVRDIRQGASDMVKAGDQASPDAQSKVEVLENRVRLSTRTLSPADAAPARDEAEAARNAAKDTPAVHGSASRESTAGRAGPNADGEQAGNGTSTMRPQKQSVEVLGQVAPVAGNGQQQTQLVQQAQKSGAAFAVMDGLRRPEASAPAPWDNQLTPLAGRLASHMKSVQAGKDETAMTTAEASGQAATQALQAFASGPGASIMSKISAAAKADPDGMAGVVAGMREGGAYADLRRGFNADLAQEKGLAASLDRAAQAVGHYGKDRAAVDHIAGFQENAAIVTARFAKLDTAIGKGASETPHSKEGKSLFDELGEKAAELARRAVDAVKAAFTRTLGAERAASGPSPSMG